MPSHLQYYKKNANPSFSFVVFLLLIFGNHLHAQTAKFSFEKRGNCAPARVIFINESSRGAGISYEWDFGNGSISHSDEIMLQEVYPVPGIYTVVLKVIEGTDTASADTEIHIYKGPEAEFRVNQTEGCAPFEARFYPDTETGDTAINSVFWNFGDGFTQVSDSPQHRYGYAGHYDVFMQVTDQNGCTDYHAAKGLITVYPAPELDFSASDTQACQAPLAVNFINHSVASVGLRYHWDFGNGSGSDSYNAQSLYSSNGIYDVTLTADNDLGCVSSLTKTSYISVGNETGIIYARQGNKIMDEPNAILCPGIAWFAATNGGSTDYTWVVNYNGLELIRQEREFMLNLADSGRLEIKLVYGRKSGCPDSTGIIFRVDHIGAGFDMDPAYSCQLPATVKLTDRSENATAMKWILPDHTEDTLSDISYVVSHDLTYKEQYSHQVNRLHFPFMQVVSSINGCRDTLIKELPVLLPVARFMPDLVSGCIPLDVAFSDSSRSDEPIQKRTYFINQASFIHNSSAPFIHHFSQPGAYEVKLAIENEAGCKDTSYAVIIRTGSRLKPDFAVMPEKVCFGDTLRLTDKTFLHDSIDFWHYSSPRLFNITATDGTGSTALMLAETPGYKPVRLEVGFNGCLSDTVFEQAFLVAPPTGSFHYTFSCDSPLVYTFIPDMLQAGSVEWTIDENVITTPDTLRYRFPAPGDYAVTLKASRPSESCTASITKTVKVRKVRAGFIAELYACYGDTVVFNARPSDDNITECYHEGFRWDFNDNTMPRRTFREEHSHVYYDTGTFVTRLIVRADNGCEDTLQQSIEVIRPLADFTTSVDRGCASGLTVKFSKTSADPYPVTWEWIFGDNTSDPSSSQTVDHRYAGNNSRIYWAGMAVEDMFGCRNDKYVPITLSKPNLFFEADDPFICAGDIVNFVAPYDAFDSFLWDFGDGSESDMAHHHVYPEAGMYDVTLVASQSGCQDTLRRLHYISVEKANADYSVNDSTIDCYPAQVLFSYTGSHAVTEGIWTFGDGVQSPGFRENYQYTYSKPGTYHTSLSIRTPNGCRASHAKTITVTGPFATFDFEPHSICYGDSVSFFITSSRDVNEMRWIFGDGETSTLTSPVHQYKAKGYIHPALLVRRNTCEVTLTYAALNVSTITAAFDVAGSSTGLCVNDTLLLINQTVGYQDIAWTINDVLTVYEPVPAPFRLSLPGVMQIGLSVTDAAGCADSLEKSYTINSLPAFSLAGDTLICAMTASSLSVIPGNSLWTVRWDPSEGLNDPASSAPTVTIDSTRHYKAVVTDENGCRSVQEITVHVMPPPLVSRIPLQDTSIFIGESVGLTVFSDNPAATYSWSPGYRISCLTCSRPVVNPEENVTYRVKIDDECYTVTELFPVEVIIDFYIEAPDAFTPNGDGNNDVFMLETRNIREIREFRIFNRWGNLVFETNRLDEGWDGTVKGKLQNMDSYAYYIRAVTTHGYETEKRGSLMLLK